MSINGYVRIAPAVRRECRPAGPTTTERAIRRWARWRQEEAAAVRRREEAAALRRRERTWGSGLCCPNIVRPETTGETLAEIYAWAGRRVWRGVKAVARAAWAAARWCLKRKR